MIDDDNDAINNLFKKMIEGLFGLSGENIFLNGKPIVRPADIVRKIDPLIELFDTEDYYYILIETSGYTEDQFYSNIKKEKRNVNLIIGVLNEDGEMAFKQWSLPIDATDVFIKEQRGSVIEFRVNKTK